MLGSLLSSPQLSAYNVILAFNISDPLCDRAACLIPTEPVRLWLHVVLELFIFSQLYAACIAQVLPLVQASIKAFSASMMSHESSVVVIPSNIH